MKLVVKLENPLKSFRLGWHYHSKTYDMLYLEDGDKQEGRIWTFELNLGPLSIFSGDVVFRSKKPKLIALPSVRGDKDEN